MKFKKGTFFQVPTASLVGLPALSQVIFMWLCRHADSSGRSFPSLKTLARECGMSDFSVKKYIKFLIERKLITKMNREKENDIKLNSNLYQVIIRNNNVDYVPAGGSATTNHMGARLLGGGSEAPCKYKQLSIFNLTTSKDDVNFKSSEKGKTVLSLREVEKDSRLEESNKLNVLKGEMAKWFSERGGIDNPPRYAESLLKKYPAWILHKSLHDRGCESLGKFSALIDFHMKKFEKEEKRRVAIQKSEGEKEKVFIEEKREEDREAFRKVDAAIRKRFGMRDRLDVGE